MLSTSSRLAAPHVERDRSERPAAFVHRDGLLPGVLMLVVAVIWLGVPLRAATLVDAEPIPGLGAPGMLVAFLVGAGFALWGLEALTRRQTITIDDDSVAVQDRRLGVVRQWRAPLSDYVGIEVRSEKIRTPRGRRLLHRVELCHRDPERSLTLAVSKDPREALRERRLLAQTLGFGQPEGGIELEGCAIAGSLSRPVAAGRRPASAQV